MSEFYTNVYSHGKNVLVRGVRDGKSFKEKIEFSPSVFIPSKKKSPKKSLKGEFLKEKSFDSSYELYQYTKENQDLFPIHGNIRSEMQFISKNYPDEIEYDLSKIRVFNIDIEVYATRGFPSPIDVPDPINAITVFDSFTDTYMIYGLEKDGDSYIADKESIYQGFSNERDLLVAFVSYWSQNYPDIVIGWNIDGFDTPYLINRISKICGQEFIKRLSPYGIIKPKTITDGFGNKQPSFMIAGVASLDYLVQYKKYTFSALESYKLDHVAYVELGERKLSYDEVSGLHELYETDYQKFIQYNKKDVKLVKGIDDKKRFIDLIISVAYYAKINYEDVISPIRTWDVIIYNYLGKQNIIIPPPSGNTKLKKFVGAYVKEPKTGKYEWVVSVDLASLYPSLIMGVSIGTDTIISESILPDDLKEYTKITIKQLINREIELPLLQKYKVSMAGSGQFFRKDKNPFLSILLELLYKERKDDKNVMLQEEEKLQHLEKGSNDYIQVEKKVEIYKVRQMVKKVLLNSVYGALGTPYFRYFDLRLAESVTMSGQVAIQWIERKINEFMNNICKTKNVDYIIAADTDSNYINFKPLVDRYLSDKTELEIINILDKFSKDKLEPFISESYNELYEYMNHKHQLMIMDREVIASKAIWTGKKQYLLRVHDSEGVRFDPPKMKIMGLSIIKSTTPEVCRKVLRNSLDMILDGDNNDLIKYIKDYKNEWYTLSPEQIAIPKSVSTYNKYIDNSVKTNILTGKTTEYRTKKGIPLQARGTFIYNKMIIKYNLENKYEFIKEGDKIKYVYLVEPNPTFGNAVAFINYLPKEFELDDYINYDLMFQKAFIQPIENILKPIGWKSEKRATLF